MPTDNYYVTKRSTGQWAVIAANATRALKLFDRKEDAVEFVNKLKSPARVTFQNKNGKFSSTTNKRKNKKSEDCFLTTACIQHYNLSDNCSQLTILRDFRDNYLSKSTLGKLQIQEYYLKAPLVVSALDVHPHKDDLYKILFETINTACDLVIKKEFEKAKALYTNVSKQLFLQLISD